MNSKQASTQNFKKPKNAEEKTQQQLAKIALLKESLLNDWDKLENQLQTGGEFRDDENFDDSYLRRWLRVHHWKLDKTESSLRVHAEWRFHFCPKNGRIQKTDISNQLSTNKILLQGTDNEGRGFAIVLCRLHNSRERDITELERLICYSLDKQKDIADIEKNPNRRISTLFDLSGVGFANIDLTFMQRYYSLLANHFVDAFGKLYLYNAPMIFWATWKAFSPVIPKEAMKMIRFIYPKDLKELHEDIPLTVLPKDYGGEAECIPVQNFNSDC
eukprot:g8629.t1